MPAPRSTPTFEEIALKWRALAERRRAHFIELFESGRWKHYGSEERFLFRMREAIRLAERWAQIAPDPAPEILAEPTEPVEPAEPIQQRTAA